MNWETGYGDWIADPLWDTLRAVPWLEKTALVLVRHDRPPRPRDPGLAADHAEARRREGREAWASASMAGSEFEYYLLTDTYEQA